MCPRITGRAKRFVGRVVCVGKVVLVGDTYRAVVVAGVEGAGEEAGLVVQLSLVACGGVLPFAQLIGHESNLIIATAIIEASHFNLVLALRERSLQLNVFIGIAIGRAIECDFIEAPSFNFSLSKRRAS